MNENFNSNYNQDELIDLKELFLVIWKNKFKTIFITFLFAVLGIFYALSIPNIYRSEALLFPTQENESLSGTMQSISGLASLAGFNLNQDLNSNTIQALEVLISRKFFSEKIYPSIFLPNLMANPSWNRSNNLINYDTELFDFESEEWTREANYPFVSMPNAIESHEFFIREILSISFDSTTGFVTLGVNHVSPFIAQKWASLIVNEINNEFRNRDHETALNSIQYLNQQIAQTNVLEVRQALSQLLQNQIQISMLTDANNEYVFRVLDPPIVPLVKNSPRRSIIVLTFALVGFIMMIVFVIIRNYAFGGIQKSKS
jgi:LPS O-antigen subunit length determinant protein (WzzB/FepE family)